MTDKNLDNLKDPTERLPSEQDRVATETIANREQEKNPSEHADKQNSSLEKHGPKIVPAKIKKAIPPIPRVRDEMSVKIEQILESGLADEFAKLSPIGKQEFKIKGEETTAKILEILQSTHLKVKKIFYLIIEWLRMLPGINKFFLEQEAKIKTDLIIDLYKKQKEKSINKIL